MSQSRHHARTDSTNCLSALNDHKLVPDGQINLFCQILQFRGRSGEGHHDDYARAKYKKRIQPLIKCLEFPLLRPQSLVKLVLSKQSEYTYLCDMHQALNADFVHQWFKLLALEVGARLEILRTSNKEDLGNYAWAHCVKALTRLHKIWETPERVRKAFGDFMEKGFGEGISLIDARQQRDRCEACVFARIGGHIDTVLGLRAVVKSRITPESQAKHPKRLRLLKLIDHWIVLWQKFHNEQRSSELALQDKQLRDNDGLSEQLWEKRRELELVQQRARRAQRLLLDVGYSASKKYKDMVTALDENADNGSIYDAENDIIDTYAALRRTQRNSRMLSAIIAYPEALEASLASEIAAKRDSNPHKSRKSGQGDTSPYSANTNPAYYESRYSVDTVRNNERAILARSVIPTNWKEGTQVLPKPAQMSTTKKAPLPIARRDAQGKFMPAHSFTANQHTEEQPTRRIAFVSPPGTASGKFENPRPAPPHPDHGPP